LDGQWLDEVHHTVHVALTGERDGYYQDHEGLHDLQPILRDRFLYAGRYSPYRHRTVGRPAPDLSYDRFVACVQNHDQVGNRMLGDRQATLLDLEALKVSAAALYLLPFTPMLWMGQEYGETRPFPYFISHTDPDLVRAVQEGRRREFAYFADHGEPPDPFDPATFEAARLDRSVRDEGEHAQLWALYRELARLRREVPAIAGRHATDATPVLHGAGTLSFRRSVAASGGDDLALVVLHVADEPAEPQAGVTSRQHAPGGTAAQIGL
jgi:maltooligosyltrehalose trehalohydrolase